MTSFKLETPKIYGTAFFKNIYSFRARSGLRQHKAKFHSAIAKLE